MRNFPHSAGGAPSGRADGSIVSRLTRFRRSAGMIPRAVAFILLVYVVPVFGETRVRELDPPIPIVDGQRIDLNEDGLNDFEIDELVHEEDGEEVRSMRLVGFTHIHYEGEIGFEPFVLLHSRYRGLYESCDRVPGLPGSFLMFESDSFIYAEFVRLGPNTEMRGHFDDLGRSYLGVSVETLKGIQWGWIEVTLSDGELVVTAIGYESIAGEISVVGGIPLAGSTDLRITEQDGGVLLSWKWSPDVDYRIEESRDLENWVLLEVGIETDGSAELGKVSLPAVEPRRYFRLLTCRKGSAGDH